MISIHGPILTQCQSLDQVQTSITNAGYTALKVVTGWGAPGAGWTREAIARVARMVPFLIVRTTAGDPSYDRGQRSLPIARDIVAEIAPWYAVQPNIFIEIGNEPNIDPKWDEQFCWDYRYFLEKAITDCRAVFPKAKLIAPALRLELTDRPQRWFEISADVMRQCDYIGGHIYEHDAWLQSEQRHGTTGQLARMCELYTRFFSDRLWMITEYGINDPATSKATKGQRYAAMVRRNACTPRLPSNVVGALSYHLCFDGSRENQYHIAPDGDVAYGREWRRA